MKKKLMVGLAVGLMAIGMTGLAQAGKGKSSPDPLLTQLQQQINDLQVQLDALQLIEGPKGDKGDTGATGPAGIFPAEIDRTPPVITTTAPLVASTSHVTFTTTMSDDVELAYIRRSNTPAGGFVFVDEGIKDVQANDSADIGLGETYSKTLMAVDTSGNVTKKTISMTTPETGIKQGTYSTVGTYSLPTGFNCLTGWGAMNVLQDGSAVTAVTMGCGDYAPGRHSWSEVDGYSPCMMIQTGDIGIGIEGNYWGPTNLPLTPLSATTLTFDQLGGSGSSPGYSYEFGYTASATLSQTNPPTMDITLNMNCNENNAGFVSGTTATFSVILTP